MVIPKAVHASAINRLCGIPYQAFQVIPRTWNASSCKGTVSAQCNFQPDEPTLPTTRFTWIMIRRGMAPLGLAYTLNRTSEHPTRFSMDAVRRSGLRASASTIPNGTSMPLYVAVNRPVVQKPRIGTEQRLRVLDGGTRSTRSGAAQASACRSMVCCGPFWPVCRRNSNVRYCKNLTWWKANVEGRRTKADQQHRRLWERAEHPISHNAPAFGRVVR